MKKALGLLAVVALLIAVEARAAVQFQLKVGTWRETSATPAVASVTVYSDADALGTRVAFAGVSRDYGDRIVIRELLVKSTQSTTVGFTLHVYSRTFTGTATNEALVVDGGVFNDAYVTSITIAASDWTQVGSGAAYARKTDIDFTYDLPAGVDTFYAQAEMELGDESFATDTLVFTLITGELKK